MGKYDAEAAFDTPAGARAYALRSGRPSVDDRMRDIGMDPSAERSTFLPRYDKKHGLTAPAVVAQALRAALSPGVAAEGGDVSPEDAVNFAGNLVGGAVAGGAVKPVEGAVAGMGARTRLPAAPRDAALKLAEKNAIKTLGLRKGNTSLERAKAMGFDLERPLYHGSLHDIQHVDLSRSDVGGHAGQGFYMTPDPKDASINYAHPYGPDVQARIERGLEQGADDSEVTRDIYERYLKKNPFDDVTHAAIEESGAGQHAGAVYPVYAQHGVEANAADVSRSGHAPVAEIYDEAADEYTPGPGAKQWQRALQVFKDYGVEPPEYLYEAMQDEPNLGNLWDRIREDPKLEVYDPDTGDPVSAGHLATQFVKELGANTVTHPTKFGNPRLNIAGHHTIAVQPTGIVRSRFAAFDPARAHESDIMGHADPKLLAAIAAGGGTAATIAALRGNKKQEK
jgi:hypothetical protein